MGLRAGHRAAGRADVPRQCLGLAFLGPMMGAKLVMPGPKLDGASVYELLETEKVTFSAAVPTVWLMLLQYLRSHRDKMLPTLKRVVIGGSACPRAMIRAFETTTASKSCTPGA
jgi:fatty-acyl-CoA synthase